MRNEHQSERPSLSDSFNLLWLLIVAHATMLTAFSRRDFGKEHFGLNALFGIAITFVYAGFANCPEVLVFLAFWFLAVIAQRIRQFKNERNGVVIHSRYNGYPVLAWKLFPWIKTEGNAKAAEAFLCMIVGWCIAQFVPPLGFYIGLGWISILASEAILVEIQKRRLQAMRDAEIEQRYLAQEYRKRR